MNRLKQLKKAARFMMIALCATLVFACDKEPESSIIESGTEGNLSWRITADGTLTISGTGEIPYMVPWWEFRSTITTVVIESGITSITQSAFSGCNNLTDVTIPNSITSIGGYAFSGCSALATVNFNAVNCSDMGGIGSQMGTSYIFSAFEGCSNVTNVKVGNEVKTIPAFAFTGFSGLTSITIPDSVTSIGRYAFFGCSGLTELIIPNSVTSIGDIAFYGCSGLTGTLTIPNSVVYIGNSAFSGCSGLTSVTIPHSVGSIGNYTFLGCSRLTSINVDAANSAYISDNGVLFNKEKTLFIQYPENKTGFYTIPDSVRIIEGSAFAGCSGLTGVTIGNSVTSIGNAAFGGCSGLTSVTIGNSVASIGYWAFGNCTSLTSVTIPNSVVAIEWFAFNYCIGLTEIINQRTTPQVIDETVFEDVNKTAITLRVPAASADAYKVATGWKDFRNIVAIE